MHKSIASNDETKSLRFALFKYSCFISPAFPLLGVVELVLAAESVAILWYH